MDVQGNYAYLIDSDQDYMKTIDVSDPSNPIEVGSINLPGSTVFDIKVEGNYAYIVGGKDPLIIVDISDPLNPVVASTSLACGDCKAVLVHDGYAYITDNLGDSLIIANVSNPNSPIFAASVTGLTFPRDVVIYQNFAYVISQFNPDIYTIDINDPNNPVLVNTLENNVPDLVQGIAKVGDFAYTAANDYLRKVDLSNPMSPLYMDSLALNGTAREIAIQDNFAYIVEDQFGDLQIIDLSCPLLVSFNTSSGKFNTIRLDSVDRQTIDTLSLNGTTLEISLENDGQVTQSLDLSGIDTDDQSIEKFNLNGTTLELSLADDGQADKTVDLSSINSVQDVIADADNDTKIQVEESEDDDNIRFDIENIEVGRFFKNANNNVAGLFIGSSGNNTFLNVNPSNNTGDLNTFIGVSSGGSNTSGRRNVFVGAQAAARSEEGERNVFLGTISGTFNKGSRNVFVGDGSGNSDTLGNNNTFLGFQSGLTSTGSANVFIGSNAGGNNVGSRSVLIGFLAGINNLEDNRLYIENSQSSSPLIYGEFDNDLVRINGDLEVTGSYPDTDDQTLSFNTSSDNLSIADGNSVDISGVDDQTLSFNIADNTLSIADGNSVDIAGVDDQTLSFNTANNTLSIADGNSVDLSSLNVGIPVGTVQMWVTETPPTDWLICDGTTFNTTTYPELNTLLNSNRVPDLRRRFPLGAQNIVNQGESSRPLNSTGGEEKVTLSIAQLPSHSHSAGSLSTQFPYLSDDDTGNERYRDGSDARLYESSSISGNTGNTGSGEAHNNMPPYYAVHFIIKAK